MGITTTLALVIIISVVTGLGWLCRTFFNDPYNDWWFDEKIWKSEYKAGTFNNLRGKMVYDVEHRVLKTGMQRQKVLDILGAPESGRSDAETIAYELGGWDPISPDVDTLIIEFDSYEKVLSFYMLST